MPNSRKVSISLLSVLITLTSAGCGIVEPASTYSIPRAVPTPTVAAKGMQFTAITSGFFHTCALDAQGRAWCWGDNQYRQTGQAAAGTVCDETSVCTMSPALVETSLRFTAISAGTTNTCAVAVDGSAWCWGGGYNGRGILGDGALTQSAQPVAVAGGIRFKAISAGGVLTCGVSIDERGYCWGRGGNIGDGGTADALTPHEVAGGYRFMSVAAGVSHACGITIDHAMYCWGDNTSGALGIGSLDNPLSATQGKVITPQKVSSALSFQSVVGGGGHTCGITVAGAAVCWGDNHVGEVGTGQPGPPVLTPNVVSSSISFIAVSAGTAHTCGIDRDGIVQCWGGNWFGGLGDGTSTAANTGSERGFPKPISSSQRFTQIANGGSHTCALATDGRVWCWGDKARGQIGNG
jgi:Alpha-tubulin suppressor and related RCC1 domain-containing proteins